MYLEEENLSVATPEHWSRSETELNWLKMGARNELLRQSRKLISPISLNQHIQFQTGRQRLLDEPLADWVEQHVSQKKPLAYILGSLQSPYLQSSPSLSVVTNVNHCFDLQGMCHLGTLHSPFDPQFLYPDQKPSSGS
jgi:hypothetical protein